MLRAAFPQEIEQKRRLEYLLQTNSLPQKAQTRVMLSKPILRRYFDLQLLQQNLLPTLVLINVLPQFKHYRKEKRSPNRHCEIQ